MAVLVALTGAANAQVATNGADELIRQQQREEALQKRQETMPDVRLEGREKLLATGRLPRDETPCFPIGRLVLKGESAEQFQWSLDAAADDGDSPLGRCLGVQGINEVMRRVQNAIIARGYVTTRVLAEPQDLKTGVLQLTLIPGRIRAVKSAPETGNRATYANAFPMGPGDLLNLRDIEQALENLKRVPTAEADIQIAPSEGADAQPGDSDLIVHWRQAFPLRVSLTADNSGTRTTGRQQGSATLSGDHLLALNDLFYWTENHSLDSHDSARGTSGHTLHYSLPFGYWQLGLTASDYNYYQSVAGASQAYVYSGKSRNSDLRLSRIVWRDAIGKTTLGLRGWVRESRNFIDDTEVAVQHRRMAGWEVNAAERLFLGTATLDAALAYRQGTGAFHALPAPEEAFGEGTSRLRLVTADVQYLKPFEALGQRLRYSLAWRAQWNQTALVPQDRFAIGGRYTVRGFDGESLLTGDRGWLVRNDLGTALGASGQEAYVGVDTGHVGGRSADLLVGKNLMGAVIGLRGGWHGATYDLFVGQPLDKPKGFQTAKTTTGFNLTWSF